MKIAVLDDYAGVAGGMADWAQLGAEVTFFREPLADPADALRRFEVVCLMRERTPFPAALIDALPELRLIVTTGPRNLSIDVAAARARGIEVCGTRSRKTTTSELIALAREQRLGAGVIARHRQRQRLVIEHDAAQHRRLGGGVEHRHRRLGIARAQLGPAQDQLVEEAVEQIAQREIGLQRIAQRRVVAFLHPVGQLDDVHQAGLEAGALHPAHDRGGAVEIAQVDLRGQRQLHQRRILRVQRQRAGEVFGRAGMVGFHAGHPPRQIGSGISAHRGGRRQPETEGGGEEAGFVSEHQ
ncbi:Rossmann-fold NAD(P)-binding domain-containing protein [Mangrovicoccus ximenensis]|uniref:hypothetical protein n=1 Tax=Mangrovicoccus ximenensis TaxID=1911570 RepID=UPI000D3A7A6D|nr:hypothetical protein [Mangrovicoccus ximenensis]